MDAEDVTDDCEVIPAALCAPSGLELTFYSGVYGTCIGAMTQFGHDAKSLIGVSGIFIGIGEILGESSEPCPFPDLGSWCSLSHEGAAVISGRQPEEHQEAASLFIFFPLCLLCPSRGGRVWDAEQEQPVWEEPSGAAGAHHSFCCLLPDFSEHRQRCPSGPGGRNGSAGLHHPQVQRTVD